ncbi:unnamed protein product, partial [Aphanomyces euteiches]
MIHYCQKYGYLDAEDQGWHFYKYHIPYDILKCDAMILQLPPLTQWTYIPTLNLTGRGLNTKRHEIWAMCTLAKIMNQAILTMKEKLCPLGYNTFEGIPMNEPKVRDTALPGSVPEVMDDPFEDWISVALTNAPVQDNPLRDDDCAYIIVVSIDLSQSAKKLLESVVTLKQSAGANAGFYLELESTSFQE